jgi:nucleoside-diphosphate-sugar epimerase
MGGVSGPWLVTGAGGFIGARVCRTLAEKGERFLGVLRPGEAMPPAAGAPWSPDAFVVSDLRDAAAVSEVVRRASPRFVLNLAGVGVHAVAKETLEDHVRVNVLVPGAICEAMPAECVLVQAGSMSQYAGWSGALAEDTAVLANGTPYAWSKNAAESLLATLAERNRRSVVLARLFGVVGPNEAPHRLLPSVVAACVARKPVDLSDGAQVRDVLHVADVAAALVHLAKTPSVAGKAVNVGRGEGRPVRWMAERAAKRLGGESLLNFGARPRHPGEAESLVADVSRLRESGFSPSMDLEKTIDAVVDAIAAKLRPRA